MNEPPNYTEKVRARTTLKFLLGLLGRLRLFIVFSIARNYARCRGAKIGRNSIIPWKLSRRANKNLIVGNDVIIEAFNIDLRSGEAVRKA